MATNVYTPGSKRRAWDKMLRYMGSSATLGETGLKNAGHARRRLWLSNGTPETLQAQYATTPYDQLQCGDLCLDTTNKLVYACSVDCAASTDATWTLISID